MRMSEADYKAETADNVALFLKFAEMDAEVEKEQMEAEMRKAQHGG